MQSSNIKQLDFLIGEWNTKGTVASVKDNPQVTFSGNDKYEYVLDGRFILHTVNMVMGDQPVKTLEFIGWDDEKATFVFSAFDNSGGTSTMTGKLLDNELHIDGGTIRATLKVVTPGEKLTAVWEQTSNGKTWAHWMDLELKA